MSKYHIKTINHINHLFRVSGKWPTVIGIPSDEFDALVKESSTYLPNLQRIEIGGTIVVRMEEKE